MLGTPSSLGIVAAGLTLLLTGQDSAPPAGELAPGAPTITFRQDGTGDFNGTGTRDLQEAINTLLETGGTVEFGPGRYVITGTVFVPPGVTLRGCEGALFALPRPVFVAEDAKKGDTEILLTSTEDFAERSLVQLLPPIGQEFFADGTTRDYRFTPIKSIEGNKLHLATPLEQDIPKTSRAGYSNKLFKTTEKGRCVFENMSFDGGRLADVPMPGHHLRTAVWISSRFKYGVGPTAPPASNVTVRNCIFRNLYGRGVAFYNAVDSVVEGCVFENIDDEAIDFDHFCYRNRAVGNDIRNVFWGVVLNDCSNNLVEYNNIDGCLIGVWAWWYHEIPKEGLNERNVVRHNTIRGAEEAALHFDRECHENTVVDNLIEGKVVFVESDNTVRNNLSLGPPEPGDPPGK